MFVLELPASPLLGTTKTTTLALAAMLPMKILGNNPAGLPIASCSNAFDPLEVVDIQSLETLVGRLIDRKKQIFIQRLGSLKTLEISDNPEVAMRPTNTRKR